MAWSFSHIEPKIINLILHSREFAVLILDHLDAKLFENETCHNVYKLFEIYFKQYKNVPKADEVKVLFNKSAKLADKFNKEEFDRIVEYKLDTSEIDFIKQEIPKFIQRKKLLSFFEQSALKVHNSSLSGTELSDDELNKLQKNFKDIMLYNFDTDLGISLFDVAERYGRLNKRAEKVIEPKLKQLALKMGGGFYAKELYAYLGEPGRGKSIFLANDAIHALLNGYNVLFISFELSEEMFSLRMDQAVMNRDRLAVLKSLNEVKEKYEMLKKVTNGNLWIKEYPTGGASVTDLERYMELLRMYKNFIPDVLFVDYGDIMKPSTGRTGKRYDDQGQVFQELRALAVTCKIPIITATQSHRRGKDQQEELLEMGNIADSFDKTRILDGLFSINQTQEEEILGEGKLKIIKNRNGVAAITVPIIINKATMIVKDKEE